MTNNNATSDDRQILAVNYVDNKNAIGRDYHAHELAPKKILKSWRQSLFAFEWLDKDGTLKAASEMKPKNRDALQDMIDRLQRKQTIERPILGIGMLDNVEIGSGLIFIAGAASLGLTSVSCHLAEKDKDYILDLLKNGK